jgi:hypothetical protein
MISGPVDALAAFDFPGTLCVLPTHSQHLLIASVVSAEPAGVQDSFLLVDDLDGGGSRADLCQ